MRLLDTETLEETGDQLEDVPINNLQGFWSLPAVDSLVVVGFLGMDKGSPVVVGCYAGGPPPLQEKEILITQENAAERLRVWWGEAEEAAGPSQHLVKGEAKEAAEAIKDFFYGNGQIINSSSRTVYAIISKTEAVIPVTSGSAYSDLIDGVVDVRGKQVYKMNENSYLEFTSEGAFVLINRDRLEGFIDNFSSEPYGIYKISDSLPEAVHEVTGYKSKAIRNWYDKARVEQ